MIDNYIGIYDAFESAMKMRSAEEKKLPKNALLSTAYLILACTYSGLTPEKQYKLFRAMSDLIKEDNPRKLDSDEIDLIASILLVAAEVRRNQIE